jgi:hypothetical protein
MRYTLKDTISICSPHEKRRKLLDSLSTLAGYQLDLSDGLPDGCRPDVLRTNMENKGLFIGDAKDSESPYNLDTRVRLFNYFRWLLIHISAGGKGILAICFGSRKDADGWAFVFQLMANEVGVLFTSIRMIKIEPGSFIIWGYIRN